MNTTTIQSRTSTDDASLVAPRRTSTAYVLPKRFDVHQVDRVRAELDGLARGSAVVRIDSSLVEMIDLAGLAALHRLVTDRTGIRLERPSVALRATANFTGHDRVVAALSFDQLVEAA